MVCKASRRAALVISVSFLIAAIAPAGAEPSDNEAVVSDQAQRPGKPIELSKPAARKKVAKSKTRVKLASRARKPVQVAIKPQSRKAREAKVEVATDEDAPLKVIPAKLANARAQLPAPPASADAGNAPLEIAAADQLNELDRALTAAPVAIESPEHAMTPIALLQQAPTATVAPPAPSAISYTQASGNRPWEESSLVGKLFIAFGGMLTLASAARMLIA